MWDGFIICHPLFLCPAFHLNGLCIFTTGPTCASWGSGETHAQTCTHMRRQRLDLQPETITCDWEPLKLVTNSILGQLIRHAWALGFLYVVIKGRVYGRPQASGWMIALTSSEPKATHGWGGMGCRQGYSHKISLWYTEEEPCAASGSDFFWFYGCSVKPQETTWRIKRNDGCERGTHTVLCGSAFTERLQYTATNPLSVCVSEPFWAI